MIATLKKTFAYTVNSHRQKYANASLGRKRLFIIGTFLTLFIILHSINIAFADVLGIDKIWDILTETIANWLDKLLYEFYSWLSDLILNMFPHTMEDFYSYLGRSQKVGVSSVGGVDTGANLATFITEPMKTVAFVLSTGLFIFHLIVCAFGDFTEQRNTPLNLIARYAITQFAVQILAIPLAKCLLNATNLIINECITRYLMITLSGYNSDIPATEALETSWQTILDVDTNATLGKTIMGITNFVNPFAWIIGFILCVSIIINVVKLIIEIYERYVVVVVLNLGMPLGMCFITSRTTANITNSYMRMYLSQLFLMLYSYISALIAVTLMGSCFISENISDQIFFLAFLRVAQKIDSLMGNLGLNVAHTSGSLFDDIAIAGRSLGNLATGMQRAGRSVEGARNRILDGQKINALKNGDLTGYNKVANAMGQSNYEGTQEALRRGMVVGATSVQDANTRDPLLKSHINGNSLDLTKEGANAFLKSELMQNRKGLDAQGNTITSTHNPIVGMKGTDFENVNYGKNGKITADYTDDKGSKKHATFTREMPERGNFVAFDTNDGGKLYMQVKDADGNMSSGFDKATASSNNEGTPTGTTIDNNDANTDYFKQKQEQQQKERQQMDDDDDIDKAMQAGVVGAVVAEEQAENNNSFVSNEKKEDEEEEAEDETPIVGNNEQQNAVSASEAQSNVANADIKDVNEQVLGTEHGSDADIVNSQPVELTEDELLNDTDNTTLDTNGESNNEEMNNSNVLGSDVQGASGNSNEADSTTDGTHATENEEAETDGNSAVISGEETYTDATNTTNVLGTDGQDASDNNTETDNTTEDAYGSDDTIPMGITNSDEEKEAFKQRAITDFDVRVDDAVAMTASHAERNDYNDAVYTDRNGELVAVQTTPDSTDSRSRFGGMNVPAGTTFYPESSENSLDSWGENEWKYNIPLSMQNEFAGKDSKPPQAENLGNGTSGVYTIYSTNVVTDEKTTTRAVSYAENMVDLNNRSSIEQFLKKDEDISGRVTMHKGSNGKPSYFTFKVKNKKDGGNNKNGRK